MGRTVLYVVGGIVAVAVVVVVIVVPCVLLLPSGSSSTTPNASDDRPSFTFDDIYNGKYNYKSIYPTWDKSTPSQTDFITMESGVIYRRDITKPNDNIDTIAPNTLQEKYNTNGYSVSADGAFIFYRYNYTKVWRHSYTADFAFWDVVKKSEVMVNNFPNTIHHMEWSPTGHKLAFVQDFTLWLIDDVGAANPTTTMVSPPGMKNMNYYGIPDWMYEEEMVSSNNVLYWNPDSTKIAYLETDETGVQLIKYSWYGDGQYPETIEIAYPKAGTTIATVKLWVYDLANSTNAELQAPDEITAGGDYYYSRFTWKNSSTCLATWTNRLQTKSIANLCKITGNSINCTCGAGNTETVSGGWVGSFGPFYPVWRTDGATNDYITIYARAKAGDATDGFWQLAYVAEGQNFVWMTNTNYDITSVTFYDSANQMIYFTAAYDLPRRRHILRVNVADRDVTDPDCMTCDLMKTYPNRCGWVSPTFTDDGSSVVINCRGYWIPLTLHIPINSQGVWQKETVIEDNTELSDKVALIKWPTVEYKTFKSDQYEKAYSYEIWYPADFDPNKKYPLLIDVYAGPEFQKVTDTWRRSFSQTYMVSGRDMIVASVDGRGSAYEGYKFMRQTYKRLGQYEPIDQTDFAKYLINENSYIDREHVAIWGWSYGGYTTSHTLGVDQGRTFKCGVAVAPLADWTWYDAMYAERYMTKPVDNAEGYRLGSIVRGHNLTNFKNTNYVLIHGTGDDNVHFQNAAEMEKALVEADVDFDDFFYADEPHSINIGPNANKHVYHQLDIRLSHCLGRVDTPYGGK